MGLSRSSRRLIEAGHISFLWILSHILLLVFVAVFGITGGVTLSLLCQEVLCGSPNLYQVQEAPTDNDKQFISYNGSFIVMNNIVYGKRVDSCLYTQYTLVCSFIFGCIWLGFFVMCRRGGESSSSADYLPQPWRIVLPALIFSTILTFVCLGASVENTITINAFCSEFDESFAKARNGAKLPRRCQDLGLFPYRGKSPQLIDMGSMLVLGEALSWLSTISWGCSAALCVLRMVLGPDFLKEPRLEEPRQQGEASGYTKFHSELPQEEPSQTNEEDEESSQKDIAVQTRSRPKNVTTSQVEVHHDASA